MERVRGFSLRNRLLSLLLIVVLLFCGLLTRSAFQLWEERAEQAQQSALELARVIRQKQQQYIDEARLLLPLLVQTEREVLSTGGRGCDQILATQLDSYSNFANFGVIGLDGNVRCSGLPQTEEIWVGDRSYFRRALETGTFSIGEYQVGRITKRSSINFGYPVKGIDGEVNGIIFAALDLGLLTRSMTLLELPDGTRVTVVDGNGVILVNYPQGTDWIGRNASEWSIVEHVLDRKDEGTAETADPSGTERLYSFTPLISRKGQRAYVIAGIPSDVAFEGLATLFLRDLGFILLFAVAICTLAWVSTNRLVLLPLNRLKHASERLNSGDLGVRAELASTVPEIAQMATTFNRMAASLEERYNRILEQDKHLRRLNRGLRTLSAGNHTLLRATDEENLMQEMCAVAVEVGGYSIAWIGCAMDDDRRSVRPAAFEGTDRDFLEHLNVTWSPQESDYGPTNVAIRTGTPQVAQNVQADPRYHLWQEHLRRGNIHSAVSLPIQFEHNRVWGAFTIYSDHPNAFDEQEVAVLQEMAEDLAYGVKTIRLRHKHHQAEAKIHRLAFFDPLTGLPNHIQFEEWLTAAIQKDQSLAVLLIGMNRFRDINSTLGFEAGDRVLRETGRRLRAVLGEQDTLARMRGDEFAVLIAVPDTEIAKARAAHILQALNKLYSLEGFSLAITASIGIVMFPEQDVAAEKLLRHADVALQKAKKDGDDYAFYATGFDEHKAYSLVLAGKLHRALESEELVVYYQPKISMLTGRVAGFEALSRWFHPVEGLIPPNVFIELAEHTGMIRAVSNWVLEEVLRQLFIWRQAGLNLPVAVNLSARNLHDPQLLENIDRLSNTWQLEAGMLEVEITENAIVQNVDNAYSVLVALRGRNIAIYIDDFGTGYSSLLTLKQHPFSAIKVDKGFVLDMLSDRDAAAIVESTLKLAKEMDLAVVAEGVENEALWIKLKELGCDIGQGFYMGKPMPASEIPAWLKESPFGLG